MRRVLTTALAAAALLAPAAGTAAADPLTVGRDKLGERVSAECRRAGVADDARCWSGIGRRVIREEVDAHQGTWLQETLAFQRRLGDVVGFADAPWLGTHNSFNSTSEDPTLSHTDSNQQLSLVDQLRLDVRSLELDVHWLPSPRGTGFAPVLCHGQGPVGCSTERLLGDHLDELVPWLDAHPGDVVLLYLEDQIDDAAGYEATARVVKEALGDRLFRPRGEGCTELPMDLTRREVRRSGAQVVVVGDCGTGAWQGVSHSWTGAVRQEGRPQGWTCTEPPAGKIVRFFEDSTFLAQTPASSSDHGLTPETVRAMTACGVDLLGFDQLLPGDGRLDATVWSWAEGEPSGGRAVVQREDGRWDAVRARGDRPAACRSASGWTLTAPVPHGAARRACETIGASFDPPRTGRENAQLLAAGGAGAWLAAR